MKSVLYCVHGLGEHIGRYDRLFQKFNAAGIRVHGFDHRGHGQTYTMNRTTMTKGHLGDLMAAMRDVDALLRLDRMCCVPRFLVSRIGRINSML